MKLLQLTSCWKMYWQVDLVGVDMVAGSHMHVNSKGGRGTGLIFIAEVNTTTPPPLPREEARYTPLASGPKMLTLPIVTRSAYSTPSQSSRGKRGNVEKFFTFTMAWKRFCYISEVSGLIHKYNNRMIIWLALAPPLLLVLIVHYPLLDLSDCRFYSFMWRIMGYWSNMLTHF